MLHPTSYILHSTPYTLHPTPYLARCRPSLCPSLPISLCPSLSLSLCPYLSLSLCPSLSLSLSLSVPLSLETALECAVRTLEQTNKLSLGAAPPAAELTWGVLKVHGQNLASGSGAHFEYFNVYPTRSRFARNFSLSSPGPAVEDPWTY